MSLNLEKVLVFLYLMLTFSSCFMSGKISDTNSNLYSSVPAEVSYQSRFTMKPIFPTLNSSTGVEVGSSFIITVQIDDTESPSQTFFDKILINGVQATLKAGSQNVFEATLPFTPGRKTITAEIVKNDKVISTQTYTFFNESVFTPRGITYRSSSNKAYVTSGAPVAIFEVDVASQSRKIISNTAIGTGTNFANIWGITMNSAGTKLYVVDQNIDALLEVDVASGNRVVISNAGTGTGTNFSAPEFLVLNAAGTKAYVADNQLPGIFEVNLSNGNRTILSNAGTGTGTNFGVGGPAGIRLNAAETKAYVIDRSGNGFLFEVDLSNGNRTVLSSDVIGAGTYIAYSFDLVLSADEAKAFVAYNGGSAILEVNLSTGVRATISQGSSIGLGPTLYSPTGLASNSDKSKLFTTSGSGYIYEIEVSNGNRSLNSTSGVGSGSSMQGTPGISGIATNTLGTNAYGVVQGSFVGKLVKIDLATGDRTFFTTTGPVFVGAFDVAINSTETKAYITDNGPDAVVEVDLVNNVHAYLSGGGAGSGTVFSNVNSLVINNAGDKIYVTDQGAAAIYEVNVSNGARTVRSNSGTGTGTNFTAPYGIALSLDNTKAYVVDRTLDAIFEVNLSNGNRTIISNSGTGTGTNFSAPWDVSIDSDGSSLYVTDTTLFAVFKVNISTGNRTMLSNSTTGVGISFSYPTGLPAKTGGDFVLVGDYILSAFFQVNKTTGDRFFRSR